MEIINKAAKYSLLAVACFALGWFSKWLFIVEPPKVEMSEIRHQGDYQYINPLLECDNFKSSRLDETVNLEANIKAYLDQAIATGMAGKVSVYYRDLNNGPWFGFNEDDAYAPASLLKVPVMIAALKHCQSAPDMLNDSILFNKDTQNGGLTPNFKAEYLQDGNYYTIDELIERMIRNSDNDAKDLLVNEFVSPAGLDEVWRELGLRGPDWTGHEHLLSAKEYSSFFRILFNATYLNRDFSEKALEILNGTKFKNGICVGVPRDIQVSHKFGERSYLGSELKQLHDCGIIYKPNTPYLLCVMSQGEDWSELEKIIQHVSLMVYRGY